MQQSFYRPVVMEPKIADAFEGTGEGMEAGRVDEVRARAQVKGLLHVYGTFRGGEHDDGIYRVARLAESSSKSL